MLGTGPGGGLGNAQAIADAILYEGYLLYPYRRSSGKNRVRWQFGVLVPPAWAQARGLTDDGVAGSAESWWQQTECLIEPADRDIVTVRLRFLQIQERSVEERRPDGTHRPVDSVRAGGRTEFSFDEAVPREFDLTARVADLLSGAHRVDIEAPGGEEVEPLADDRGVLAGRVLRRRWPVSASVTLSADSCATANQLLRVRVRVENSDRSTAPDSSRDQALRRSLLATHTLLATGGSRFISLIDPPTWAAAAARDCRNVHTFPVLAGAPGRAEVVLSAPIILYDYPEVAPESPGDLHDGTEIDEILSLRTLTLTDAEKQEARATDRRAAAIVDRVDAMPPEIHERLHGAIRSLRPARAGVERQSGELGGGLAEDGVVLVAGTRLTKGSRVRLWPRQSGTDAHDMFLHGRTAQVQQVLHDVDGSRFLAVTVDDDPGAELHHWYGRLRHFRPDEVEPLAGDTEPA
jgi:hypothetical protein